MPAPSAGTPEPFSEGFHVLNHDRRKPGEEPRDRDENDDDEQEGGNRAWDPPLPLGRAIKG